MSQCNVAAQKRARRKGSLASKHSVTSRVLTPDEYCTRPGPRARVMLEVRGSRRAHCDEEAGMTELNWMQEYAAAEAIELREAGALSRREMLVRLVAICGSVGAATAFLASCGNDSAKSTSSASTEHNRRRRQHHHHIVCSSGRATGDRRTARPRPLGRRRRSRREGRQRQFPGPASTMLGYLAATGRPGHVPGRLVNHEIFGLTITSATSRGDLPRSATSRLAVDLVSRAGGSDKPRRRHLRRSHRRAASTIASTT